MPLTTGQQVLDAVAGAFPASSDTVATSMRYWLGIRKHIHVVKELADAAAGTATTLPIAIIPAQCRVVGVKFYPGAGLTSNDTNYATLTLTHDDAAAGSPTTIAAISTTATGGSGSWTAKVGVAITLTAANVVVAAGKQLMLAITKTASGVAVPAGTLEIIIEPA